MHTGAIFGRDFVLTSRLHRGRRPRTPLAKAIVLVLVIKLIGIAGMKVFMFPEGAQPVVDANAMARVVGVTDLARDEHGRR